jgi:hypothetical protein
MWMFLQYLKDMFSDAMPFIYGITIVLVAVAVAWSIFS